MKGIPREVEVSRTHKVTNSISIRNLRNAFSLNDEQKSILIGSLLGDANLNCDGWSRNYRLQFSQGDDQKDYLFWKFNAFRNCCASEPSYQKWNNSWRIRTISHPEFNQYALKFYPGENKVLPEKIEDLLDPLSIAVWFMDDGTLGPKTGYTLNTQNFSYQENYHLQRCLDRKFLIKETSIHRDRKWWRLYIRKGSATTFRKLIEPFVIDSMKYKLQLLTP